MTALLEPVAEPPVLAEGIELAPGYVVIGHFHRARALDVYEVWSDERSCHCMAKVLRPDREDDAAPRQRLLREGRLLARLTHPHIVRGYETIKGPRPVVVLETVGGMTVGRLLRERGRLPVADVAELGLQLASALSYLHRHGILHLDVKPANVIAEHGRARLLDLSLVRRPGRGVRGRGTRLWMSPEQARGGQFTPACDVWGLGALLYRALAGVAPFAGDEPHHPQLAARAASVRGHRRLPAKLADVVDACLDPDPAGRPSLDGLADVLDEHA